MTMGHCCFIFIVGSLTVLPVYSLCRALALSGGGTRGSYEMGALAGLVENLDPAEVTWDVVTGISTGSLNALGISTFPIGDEKNMTETLVGLWAHLTAKDVFQNWTTSGPHTGTFDTSPLRNTITRIMGNPPTLADRKIVIGAASLNTGLFHTWTEKDADMLVEAAMCSSAIPGYFPTQTISSLKDTFSDGGDIIMGINVFDAVKRCQETESEDANIVVDTIATWGGGHLQVVDASTYTAEEVVVRNQDLANYLQGVAVIESAQFAYPRVNWRYSIAPSTQFPGDSLNFDPADLATMINMGRADAVEAIKKGRGKKADKREEEGY